MRLFAFAEVERAEAVDFYEGFFSVEAADNELQCGDALEVFVFVPFVLLFVNLGEVAPADSAVAGAGGQIVMVELADVGDSFRDKRYGERVLRRDVVDDDAAPVRDIGAFLFLVDEVEADACVRRGNVPDNLDGVAESAAIGNVFVEVVRLLKRNGEVHV